MDTIYYYYYLFYKQILKDNTPNLLATLALSASEFFPVFGIIDFTIWILFHSNVNINIMFVVLLLCAFFNYLHFHKTGRAKRIIKEKPMFFNNHKASIFITILFFLFTVSFLFWGPILSKHLREMYPE